MNQAMFDENQEVQNETALIVDFFKIASAQKDSPFSHKTGLLGRPRLFGLEKFQAYLNNPLLGADWVQVTVGGKLLDISASCLWKNIQTKKLFFIDKQALNDAIARGAAVVLEGLDILDSRINYLQQRLDEAMPCALSNCVAFFSQKGNEAYGGHRDSDDVLVLQISGEKRWRVHRPQPRRYLGNTPLTEAEMGPLLSEFVMRPGDALFLHAGVPHRCVTHAEHSLHLSFDLCDRTPNIEQITHAANELYNHASALPYVAPREIVERYIQHLNAEKFQAELVQATTNIRSQAQEFRKRIGRTSNVNALDKFL